MKVLLIILLSLLPLFSYDRGVPSTAITTSYPDWFEVDGTFFNAPNSPSSRLFSVSNSLIGSCADFADSGLVFVYRTDANSYYIGQFLSCDNYYRITDSYSVNRLNCPPGQVATDNGFDGFVCSEDISCPPCLDPENMIQNEEDCTCRCPYNMILEDSVCTACPDGYHPNFDDSGCTKCPVGEVPSFSGDVCSPECSDSGSFYYPVSEICEIVIIGVDQFCYDCDLNFTPTTPPDYNDIEGDTIPDINNTAPIYDQNNTPIYHIENPDYNPTFEAIGDSIGRVGNDIKNLQERNNINSESEQRNQKELIEGQKTTNQKLDDIKNIFDNNGTFPSFDFSSISAYSSTIISDFESMQTLYQTTYNSVSAPLTYSAPSGGACTDTTVNILGQDYTIPLSEYISNISPFIVFLMRLSGIVLSIKIYFYSISIMFRS